MCKNIKCPKCGQVFTIDEASYESIVKQIRDEEFNKQVAEREKQFEKEKESAIKLAEADIKEKLQEEINKKEKEITELKNKIELGEANKELEISKAVLEKDKKISELSGQIELSKKDFEIKEKNIKESYEEKIKDKDELIERYKDFKTRLSTKMLGETLEIHCKNLYERQLRPFLPHSTFEKDTKASEGTKGDYIFRDYDDEGNEIVSIMFEMKNEADETATKHKNEDFFKKLDKDRRDKNCEYAVLVSLLEMDNDEYNDGIVNKSHIYEKMYVIRPQFFVPMITLIHSLAAKTIEYRKELEKAKSEHIDVTNFEDRLEEFTSGIGKSCKMAGENFAKAIKEIDKSIKSLQNIREYLTKSAQKLEIASGKAEDLTIKRLTYGNETMKKLFKEAKEKKELEAKKAKS